MLILANHVSIRQRATVKFTFEGIFCHASCDLFGQFRRVILCHAFQYRFQNNAFCTFGDGFGSRYDTDIVFLQRSFVSCRVKAVSGKPIQFPNDDHIETLLSAIFDHSLKLGPIVGFSRYRSVNVCANNFNTVLFCVCCILTQLTFNGFLTLRIRGIPRINNTSHIYTLPSAWF